jgi:hypothetical protein
LCRSGAGAGAEAIRASRQGVVPLRRPPHPAPRFAILSVRPARVLPSLDRSGVRSAAVAISPFRRGVSVRHVPPRGNPRDATAGRACERVRENGTRSPQRGLATPRDRPAHPTHRANRPGRRGSSRSETHRAGRGDELTPDVTWCDPAYPPGDHGSLVKYHQWSNQVTLALSAPHGGVRRPERCCPRPA